MDLLNELTSKKEILDGIMKNMEKTKIQEKKRMTANHTYNSKTQRGRLTQISKSYFAKNRSAFINPKLPDLLHKTTKGSIFNAAKDAKRHSSKLDLEELKRINSFRTSNISSVVSKELIEKKQSFNEDNVIVFKNKDKTDNPLIKIKMLSRQDIYSEDSEEALKLEKSLNKVEIIKQDAEQGEDQYAINLTSVHNEKEGGRRRVKTSYTRNEIDKIFEHKKNSILISKASKLIQEKEEESDFLRVFTNQKRLRNKSNRPLNRSNTMVSGRSRSIQESNEPEDISNLLKFMNNGKGIKERSDKSEKSGRISGLEKSKEQKEKKERKVSVGTSIDRPNMNTSIVKDNSKDSSTQYNDLFNREKSTSDPFKDYKLKYMSDNVLGQLGRFNDDLENVNRAISIKDFKVVKELGSGKFGKVIQVKRKINGDVFAVKLIPIKNSLNKVDEENLNSESEIFKTISDKYVVKAYYCLIHQSMLCFFMEFMPEGSFSDFLNFNLDKGDIISSSDFYIYAAHMVKGLKYLHSKNIIHRDLKPDNILVDSEGYLKITDFGLSRIVNEMEKKVEGNSFNSSMDSSDDGAVGTPDYMAIELVEERKTHQGSVDWWSLGCILFQMIWGYPPFNDRTIAKIFDNIKKLKIEWSWEDKIANPERYNLVMSLLHPDPKKRLGANGAEEVMAHPFFANIDWKGLEKFTSPHMEVVRGRNKSSQKNLQTGPGSNKKGSDKYFKFSSIKSSRSRQSSKNKQSSDFINNVDLMEYLDQQIENLDPLEEPITENGRKEQIPGLKPFYKKDNLKKLNHMAFEKKLNKVKITDKEMKGVFIMVDTYSFIVNFFINYDFLFDFK